MPSRSDAKPEARPRGFNASALSGAVLLRVTGQRGEALSADRIGRDLGQFLMHRLSPGDWRTVLDKTLVELAEDGSITRLANRVAPTSHIWRRRDGLLGCRVSLDTGWAELRDVHLVARALDIIGEPRRRRTLLGSEGLRRAVLEKAFDQRFRDAKDYASLRDALARLALRRGSVIGDAAVASRLLPPKERRAQAATLLNHVRRPPATDAQLVAAMAAEQLGAHRTSAGALRLELLRRHLTGDGFALGTVAPPPRRRFDLAEFLQEVRNFARQLAQGWQGNRRALISRVFPALTGAHPDWGLDVTRFKLLLADAHRAGRLSLVNADLRDRSIIAELQASAVAYHNMILHFIRVEDEASDAA